MFMCDKKKFIFKIGDISKFQHITLFLLKKNQITNKNVRAKVIYQFTNVNALI